MRKALLAVVLLGAGDITTMTIDPAGVALGSARSQLGLTPRPSSASRMNRTG